jgi:hypothetical protein
MTAISFDPYARAKAKADTINQDREVHLDWAVQRVLLDAPHMDKQSLLQGLDAFHAQRMETIPSHQKYPEAAPWVQLMLTYEKELKKQADLTSTQVAQIMSMGDYLRFRAFKQGVKPAASSVEKCRVAFVPDTDRGVMHIKNVDDPSRNWAPDPTPKALPFGDKTLAWDGTGSGLHIDDEPEEIFPLDVHAMLTAEDINDVPGAVAFLTRYGKFWSRANCVLHDEKQRSVAIEKCTRNHMQVHYPGPDGRSWCSGMVCRDKNSDIAKYQAAKRNEYIERFNLPKDGPDVSFWNAADRLEVQLANLITSQPKPASSQAIIDEFLKPYSKGGLNKDGTKSHPQQGHAPYTLNTRVMFLDQKVYLRWNRDKNMNRPDQPERFEFR